ncbi:MAG: YdcF family protein [Parvicellaceae bacterium]
MILLFSNSLIFNYFNDLWSVKNVNEKEHYQIGILLGGMISLTSSEENIQFSNHNDRLLNTLDLFHSKKIDKILITGAAGSLSSDLKESQILKKYLNKVGVPDSCILIEDKSKNTYENAIYCEKILNNFPINNSYLVITSDYHMRRSLACFKKTHLNVYPFVKKSDIKHFDLEWILIPQSNILFEWKVLFHEMIGYITYKAIGYI